MINQGDLHQLTFKVLFRNLEEKFKCDLISKKKFLRQVVQDIVSEKQENGELEKEKQEEKHKEEKEEKEVETTVAGEEEIVEPSKHENVFRMVIPF